MLFRNDPRAIKRNRQATKKRAVNRFHKIDSVELTTSAARLLLLFIF